MKLYVMRHGLTHSNKMGVLNGQKIDEPLEPEGIAQAEEARKTLPKHISKIYCSNMLRAIQTADILNKDLDLPIVQTSELREVDFGDFSGKSWQVISEEFGKEIKESWINQNYDFSSYHGESFNAMKDRTLICIEEIKSKYKDEDVLMVTHGGVLRVLYHIYKGEHYEGFKSAVIHEFEV